MEEPVYDAHGSVLSIHPIPLVKQPDKNYSQS